MHASLGGGGMTWSRPGWVQVARSGTCVYQFACIRFIFTWPGSHQTSHDYKYIINAHSGPLSASPPFAGEVQFGCYLTLLGTERSEKIVKHRIGWRI